MYVIVLPRVVESVECMSKKMSKAVDWLPLFGHARRNDYHVCSLSCMSRYVEVSWISQNV